MKGHNGVMGGAARGRYTNKIAENCRELMIKNQVRGSSLEVPAHVNWSTTDDM